MNIGGEHFALEIRDRFDRAIAAHHELVGAMTSHAILDFVADDAQVLYMRVVDGKLEG